MNDTTISVLATRRCGHTTSIEASGSMQERRQTIRQTLEADCLVCAYARQAKPQQVRPVTIFPDKARPQTSAYNDWWRRQQQIDEHLSFDDFWDDFDYAELDDDCDVPSTTTRRARTVRVNRRVRVRS